jgi:SMC interacting uncharacterized protein involved in chromosome segregation
MNTDQPYGDRFHAQLRAADARIDELEAGARARNAQAEMDEISGLRAQRDRVRKKLADVRQQSRDDWEAVRKELEPELSNFRSAVADASDRYTEWDQARERRFNARLDEAEAALRKYAAQDAEVAADARARIAEAGDDLKARAAGARRSYDDWRQRREDKAAVRALTAAELELEEAFDRYALVIQSV